MPLLTSVVAILWFSHNKNINIRDETHRTLSTSGPKEALLKPTNASIHLNSVQQM